MNANSQTRQLEFMVKFIKVLRQVCDQILTWVWVEKLDWELKKFVRFLFFILLYTRRMRRRCRWNYQRNSFGANILKVNIFIAEEFSAWATFQKYDKSMFQLETYHL